MLSQKSPEPEMSSTQTAPSGIPEAEKGSIATASLEPGRSSVDIVAIPKDRLAAYWPHAKRFIEPAFGPGEYSEQDTARKLLDGDWQLWVAAKEAFVGAFLTEIVRYPGFGAIRIVALGADDFDWIPDFDRMIDLFAKHHGCQRIEFFGRRGWERRLKHYRFERIMMSRQV